MVGKRALEIATTLALDPEMMLLDEPMAGMGHEDIDKISALIQRIAKNHTILMVEHNLSVSPTCPTSSPFDARRFSPSNYGGLTRTSV